MVPVPSFPSCLAPSFAWKNPPNAAGMDEVLPEQLLTGCSYQCLCLQGPWSGGWTRWEQSRGKSWDRDSFSLAIRNHPWTKPSAFGYHASYLIFRRQLLWYLWKNIYKLDFPRLRYGKHSKPLGKCWLKQLNVQNISEYHWTVDVVAEHMSQICSVCQKWVRKVL